MNALNFQSWINLFALTVELFSGFPVNENFSVKTYLDDLSKIHFSSNKENKGLYIDFYCEKPGERLISYILVPWQDLYPVYKQNDIPIAITENVKLVTVNPFCILFETNAPPAPSENQVVILEKITNMLSKEEIENIVRKQIESDEKTGMQTGGSGHSSFVTYKIDDIKTRALKNNKLEIEYRYTIFVETEFTYYPDNPPHEYQHSKKIIYN